LGLPGIDEFWSSPSMPWTAIKAWGDKTLSVQIMLWMFDNKYI